jgi:hypothetical protein
MSALFIQTIMRILIWNPSRVEVNSGGVSGGIWIFKEGVLL